MYEELIKRLKTAAQWADKGLRIPPSLCLEAADAIEELEKFYQIMADAYETEVTKERWIPVTERLPDKFQFIFAACKSEGHENWTIDTVYDPFLECPWGRIPILETGKAVVYAWMDNSAPEPPKEEEM